MRPTLPVVVAALVAAATPAHAEDAVPLSGHVVSASSGAPVPGVVVRVVETGAVALGDDAGRFTFAPQPPGIATLEVIAGGYHIEPFRITLTAGQPMVAELKLQPVGATDGDVMVIEDRRETIEPVVRKITVEELQRIPGAFGDAVRAVQNLPGVSRSPFGLGALIVRGTEPRSTGIYVDGVRVPLIFHFGGLVTTLNSDVLDRVEFIPGGFSARYGRQLGGVVDVATKEYIPLKPTGYADIDLFDTTLFFATPIGDDHGLTASVRRSYIDLIVGAALSLAPADAGGGASIVQLPVYEDYQLMWDHRRGDKHRFHATLFGSRDRFSIEVGDGGGAVDPLIVEGGGAELSTINHKLVGKWTFIPGARLTSKLTLGTGPDSNQLSLGAISVDASPWSLFVREDLAFDARPWLELRGGLDGLVQWYSFELEIPSFSSDDPLAEIELLSIEASPRVVAPAPWAEAEIRLGEIAVTPGLRVDPYLVFNDGELVYARTNLDPRLNARWRVAPKAAIKASVGRYSNGVEPFAVLGDLAGDDPPGLEWAFQASLGYEQRITEDIGVSATAYWSEQRDLLGFGADGAFGNTGAGFSRGIEALVRHDPGKAGFFGWVSYTLQQAERVDDFASACPRSGDGGDADCSPWYRFDYDQTHILTVVASQRLKKGWELGLRFRYTTGSPYTPLEPGYYDFDEDSYVATSGETNSVRYPAFHQLDLRVDKRWTRRWGEVAAALEILNVYNRKNPEAATYSYDYSEVGYVSGIPFFPSFGLKVKF